jgi:hypothetical protein
MVIRKMLFRHPDKLYGEDIRRIFDHNYNKRPEGYSTGNRKPKKFFSKKMAEPGNHTNVFDARHPPMPDPPRVDMERWDPF